MKHLESRPSASKLSGNGSVNNHAHQGKLMNDVEAFLDRHETSRFPHSEKLIPGIKSGQCILLSYPTPEKRPVPAKELLDIYRFRAKYLQQFKTRTSHAQSLLEDELALCNELEKTSNATVNLWAFSMAPYYIFAVFEDAVSFNIYGCIFAIDGRLMDPNEWKALWEGTPDGDNLAQGVI